MHLYVTWNNIVDKMCSSSVSYMVQQQHWIASVWNFSMSDRTDNNQLEFPQSSWLNYNYKVALQRSSPDWTQHCRYPAIMWLCVTEKDIKLLNYGLHMASGIATRGSGSSMNRGPRPPGAPKDIKDKKLASRIKLADWKEKPQCTRIDCLT